MSCLQVEEVRSLPPMGHGGVCDSVWSPADRGRPGSGGAGPGGARARELARRRPGGGDRTGRRAWPFCTVLSMHGSIGDDAAASTRVRTYVLVRHTP
jgi:hypothetical protein